jgi:hypothetical protein
LNPPHYILNGKSSSSKKKRKGEEKVKKMLVEIKLIGTLF